MEVDEGSSPLVKLSVASVIAGGPRQVISQQRLVQVICKMYECLIFFVNIKFLDNLDFELIFLNVDLIFRFLTYFFLLNNEPMRSRPNLSLPDSKC